MNRNDLDPHDDLCSLPLVVHVEQEAVVLLGPDGVHLAMTADAAAASSDLLRTAAETARNNARAQPR